MSHSDKRIMKPIHFGSDPADIQIRIRSNPEIRTRIPDQILTLSELYECCRFPLFFLFVSFFVNALTVEPFEIPVKVLDAHQYFRCQI